MTAVIEGVQWQSGSGPLTSPAQTTGPGGYVVTGTSQAGGTLRSISLTLMNVPGPGTYPLGTGANVSGGTAIVADPTGGWLTPLSGEAGSITITTLSTTRLVATFSFVAEATSGGATGTRTVTGGTVDVPVSVVVAGGPVPERSRNRVTASFGGVAWHAATVSSTGPLGSGTFSFGASNTRHQLTVALTGFAGVGTYPLGGSGAMRVASVQVSAPVGGSLTGPGCCWNGGLAGASGTLSVTAATPQRIQGTFSFTLPPQPGTGATAPLVLTGGTFDLGLGG